MRKTEVRKIEDSEEEMYATMDYNYETGKWEFNCDDGEVEIMSHHDTLSAACIAVAICNGLPEKFNHIKTRVVKIIPVEEIE